MSLLCDGRGWSAVREADMAFDKPEEMCARSDAVFLGTVLTTEATGTEGDHVIVDIATFRVQRSWKGKPAREIRVGSDRPFEKNRQYVVFAAGKPLTTSILCRWAEPSERAKVKLEWLSKRQLPDKVLQPAASASSR